MKNSFPLCLLATAAFFAITSVADARVVRPSPDFSWAESPGTNRTLSSLLGQPVMILIAPSPRDSRFRAQMRRLQSQYQRIAAQNLVCIAAFTEESGRVDSNIPVIVANDGPRVAFLYEVPEGFAVGMVGRDGNLDYITRKVLPAQRVLDIIGNSFVRQEYLRRP
jgi:hypothetical protein